MRAAVVAALVALGAVVAALSRAESAGVLPRGAQCSSLEALARIAQAKIASGVRPTGRQVEEYRRRQEWYDKNCRAAK